MTREEAKSIMPILQAFAEGKTIQSRYKNAENEGVVPFTEEKGEIDFHFDIFDYRIKPSPIYRPFANAEECWQEMLKHQPCGWVIKSGIKIQVCEVPSCGVVLHHQSGSCYDFKEANRILTFADGTPFGIKEESEE